MFLLVAKVRISPWQPEGEAELRGWARAAMLSRLEGTHREIRNLAT
jgi:hypothetical protein